MKVNVTEKSLHRAYRIAANALLADDAMSICARDAGTEMGPDGDGVQVFVQVYRFSKKLLKADRDSGGLIAFKSTKCRKKSA